MNRQKKYMHGILNLNGSFVSDVIYLFIFYKSEIYQLHWNWNCSYIILRYQTTGTKKINTLHLYWPYMMPNNSIYVLLI